MYLSTWVACVGRLILWTVSHALLSRGNSESSFKVYEAKIVESQMSRGLGKDCIYLHLSQKYMLFCLFGVFYGRLNVIG